MQPVAPRSAHGDLTVSLAASLADVAPAEWDLLAGDDNPFVEHAFLRLLETSGSVGPGTGWQPRHVLVRRAGVLVGAAPTYVKSHSYGEYIFDWAWAEAAMRAGLPYYPKLVVGVPFTPATGPRFLRHPRASAPQVRDALFAGLRAACKELSGSGIHVLFALDHEADALARLGMSRRATHQYHWRNDGYGSFEDFLAALRAPARKQIRRERRRVVESGVEIEVVRGDALHPPGWQRVYELYLATGKRKWGDPYLTAAFFEQARETVGHRVLVVLARRRGRIVAMALSFEKGRHLYGRYWGADSFVDGLHFELCYYRLIEHAIATQKTLVEAGAQGEHKLKRGFVPVVTHSAHWLSHPGLHQAVSEALREEQRETAGLIEALGTHLPFRSDRRPGLPSVAGIALN
jgi:predicted N-acyltransferase